MAVTEAAVQAEITRGPLDHDVRSQLKRAANEHFRHYGYGKTTVSDLARTIGLSKAYIYKFFDSKQAIGEAICSQHLAIVSQNVLAAVDSSPSSVETIRTMFGKALSESLSLFFTDRKLHDLCVHAVLDRWASSVDYERRVEALIRSVIKHGRQNRNSNVRRRSRRSCGRSSASWSRL
jgi:AcrR family transcriptional regulator